MENQSLQESKESKQMKNAINLENLFVSDIKELYLFEALTQDYLKNLSRFVNYEQLNFLIRIYNDETEFSKRRLEKISNLRDFSLNNADGLYLKKFFDEIFKDIENENDNIIRHIKVISFIERLINYKLAIYRMISVYSSILGFEKPVRMIEDTIEEKVKTFCEFLYLTEEMRDHLRSQEVNQNGVSN